MKKRRFFALLLSVLLLLSLTACSAGQPQGSTSPETEAQLSSSQESSAVPVLTVTSTIFGSGDTGGKTTLKKILLTAEGPGDQTIRYSDPQTGERLDYPVYNEDGSLFEVEQPPVSYTGSAILTLEGGDLEDSKIDSSNAVVKLAPGDGYYADELILNAATLEGAWENGVLEYTLKAGDLEWNTGDYLLPDDNSGREWSILGGDGNGCYVFNLEVSGITYDGQPVNAAVFQVPVYIWGRTGTDLAPEIVDLVPENNLPSGTAQGSDIQWTWVGDTSADFLGAGAKPVLCDDQQDDFFITWPEGTDASGLTANDVTVTLHNQYGVDYQLKSEGEHVQYAVFSSEGETQVAVTFRHAAFTPVFTTMTIAVDGSGVTASQTYDIASVYAYMVQQGGGGITVDGTVTAYSYYGYEGLSAANATQATYVLKTEVNGETVYYAEDADGTPYLAKTEESAGSGIEGFGGLGGGMDGPDGDLDDDIGGFGGSIDGLDGDLEGGGLGGFGGFGGFAASSVPEDAVVYDAMGENDCDVQFLGNTLYVKTRLDKTEAKTVDGKEITFEKEYTSGAIENYNGAMLAPGYVQMTGFSLNQQWAWSQYYGSGWSPELGVIPTGVPYTSFPFGDYASRYTVQESGMGGFGGPIG